MVRALCLLGGTRRSDVVITVAQGTSMDGRNERASKLASAGRRRPRRGSSPASAHRPPMLGARPRRASPPWPHGGIAAPGRPRRRNAGPRRAGRASARAHAPAAGAPFERRGRQHGSRHQVGTALLHEQGHGATHRVAGHDDPIASRSSRAAASSAHSSREKGDSARRPRPWPRWSTARTVRSAARAGYSENQVVSAVAVQPWRSSTGMDPSGPCSSRRNISPRPGT